jgi:AcrR family transcriptional regulator
VPSQTFYRHFPDTDQCLLAAYDRFFERLMTHIEAARDDRDPWPVQVKAAIGAALGFFAEVAGAGRVFAVEGLSIGPAALERCFASVESLAELLRRGRDYNQAAASLPAATEQILVAGVALVISRHLLAEEGALLPSKEPEMAEAVLTPFLGGNEAKRIAHS